MLAPLSCFFLHCETHKMAEFFGKTFHLHTSQPDLSVIKKVFAFYNNNSIIEASGKTGRKNFQLIWCFMLTLFSCSSTNLCCVLPLEGMRRGGQGGAENRGIETKRWGHIYTAHTKYIVIAFY